MPPSARDSISAIRGLARKCHAPAPSDVPADAGLASKSGGSWQIGETQMALRVGTPVRGLGAGASTAQMTRGYHDEPLDRSIMLVWIVTNQRLDPIRPENDEHRRDPRRRRRVVGSKQVGTRAAHRWRRHRAPPRFACARALLFVPSFWTAISPYNPLQLGLLRPEANVGAAARPSWVAPTISRAHVANTTT